MVRCKDCAIAHLGDNGNCPIFNENMQEYEGCPMFAAHLSPCAICGRHIMGNAIIDQDDSGNFHQICMECAKKDKCSICINATNCRFNNMSIHPELQPHVMKVMQRGSTTIQTAVINEKRVEVVCTNCPCYNSEDKVNFCLFQLHQGCKNYKIDWKDGV